MVEWPRPLVYHSPPWPDGSLTSQHKFQIWNSFNTFEHLEGVPCGNSRTLYTLDSPGSKHPPLYNLYPLKKNMCCSRTTSVNETQSARVACNLRWEDVTGLKVTLRGGFQSSFLRGLFLYNHVFFALIRLLCEHLKASYTSASRPHTQASVLRPAVRAPCCTSARNRGLPSDLISFPGIWLAGEARRGVHVFF